MFKISQTLEDFLEENQIDKSTLFLLGEGSSGKAYQYIKDNEFFVIKETSSVTEFNFACRLYASNNPFNNMAKIYNIAKSEKYYYIISEYVNTDEWRVFRYYNQFMDFIYDELEIDLETPEDLMNLNLSGLETDNTFFETDDLRNFVIQFLAIIKIYKKYGANDLHIGNLGYSEDGLYLKAFDMDIASKEQQLVPVINKFILAS